ncbi:MAG: hypothetical protein Alpg2KO_26570 [Alphaproteobacteria bacterium]
MSDSLTGQDTSADTAETDKSGLLQKLACALSFYDKAGATLSKWAEPAFLLWVRVFIAMVFFKSGIQKIMDWESTLFLFEYEYALPFLPVKFAAVSGTAFELLMPLALVVGLLTRLAAIPLLIMAIVIQFVLGAENKAYDSWEHFLWITALVLIVVRGSGRFGLDHWLPGLLQNLATKFISLKQAAITLLKVLLVPILAFAGMMGTTYGQALSSLFATQSTNDADEVVQNTLIEPDTVILLSRVLLVTAIFILPWLLRLHNDEKRLGLHSSSS